MILAIAVADGSRTTPADPTTTLSLRGASEHDSVDSDILRVATFNIHSGRGSDRRTDLTRTARVFVNTHDLIGLNEVRGTWAQSWASDQAAQLGDRLQMQSVFVPTERRWWHDHFGNAILTRIPLQQIHRLPLAGSRRKAFRNAVLAQFQFQSQSVQLLSVHVDSQTDRELQLKSVISLFLGLQAPAILIGDLNTTADDPQMQELLRHPEVVNPLRDAPPDARGRTHIDWILARGFRSLKGELVENDASDHPAAIAELQLVRPRND